MIMDGCQGKPRTPTIEDRICPNCGRTCSREDSFCPGCGTEL